MLAVWQATIVDRHGDIVSNASVQVLLESSGALAALFSDRDGETPIDNPITADENGFVRFYAAGNSYRITATSGSFSRTWRHVPIGLLSELDFVPGTMIQYEQTDAEVLVGITPTNYAYAPYNVLRYGADPTGVEDSTDAFNRACAAAAEHDGNETILKREIIVPGGQYQINGQVWVHKGQHLRGAGMGATYIDLSGAVGNAFPSFTLAANSADETDLGGLAPEISGMFFYGGSASHAVIDAQRPAGFAIHDCFFTSSGLGILAAGGDGLIYDCVFDQGLTGIRLSGQNILISNCLFYLFNNQIAVASNCFDCQINACHFEYAQERSILLDDGATNIKNLAIRSSTFLLNVQHAGHQHFIGIRSMGADIFVTGCSFRNGKGAAVGHETGLGNRVVITDCIVDGNQTNPDYHQGTTSQGIVANNMHVTARNVVFRNLTGQPITFGGTTESNLLLEACTFENCTGGTTDIAITNNVSSSRLFLRGIHGSGRLLFNAQPTVLVFADGLRRWLDPMLTAGGRDYVLVPHQFSNLYRVALRVNLNVSGSANYRKSILLYVQKDNDFAADEKSFVNVETAIEGAANLNGAIDVAVEFEAVGGGIDIATSNSGFLCISWPSAYTAEDLDVQIIQ